MAEALKYLWAFFGQINRGVKRAQRRLTCFHYLEPEIVIPLSSLRQPEAEALEKGQLSSTTSIPFGIRLIKQCFHTEMGPARKLETPAAQAFNYSSSPDGLSAARCQLQRVQFAPGLAWSGGQIKWRVWGKGFSHSNKDSKGFQKLCLSLYLLPPGLSWPLLDLPTLRLCTPQTRKPLWRPRQPNKALLRLVMTHSIVPLTQSTIRKI